MILYHWATGQGICKHIINTVEESNRIKDNRVVRGGLPAEVIFQLRPLKDRRVRVLIQRKESPYAPALWCVWRTEGRPVSPKTLRTWTGNEITPQKGGGAEVKHKWSVHKVWIQIHFAWLVEYFNYLKKKKKLNIRQGSTPHSTVRSDFRHLCFLPVPRIPFERHGKQIGLTVGHSVSVDLWKHVTPYLKSLRLLIEW